MEKRNKEAGGFIAKPMNRRMGLFDFLEKWFCFSMIDDLSGVRLATIIMSGLTIKSRKKTVSSDVMEERRELEL